MTQQSTNSTFHIQTTQHKNANATDANSVEFLSGTPTDLSSNAKRIWVDQTTPSLKYTVDGVVINSAASGTEVSALASQVAANTTAITNIGSGSPKGAFPTLAALQAAFPTGTTGIYVVTADGKWYYYNGAAWTAGGTYQATAIADGSITPAKTTFYVGTLNLFNKDSTSNIPGQTMDPTTGAVSPDATRFITHYADVTALVGKRIATYFFVGTTLNATATFFYDASMVFINSVNGQSIVPANARYVRSRPPIANISSVMIWTDNTTTAPTTYTPFAYVDANQVYYNSRSVSSYIDEFGTKLAEPISVSDTSFKVGTLNLFDKDSNQIILGQTMDPSTGAVSPDPTRFITPYINVSTLVGQKIATYFMNSGVYSGTSTFFYDTNKVFINSMNGQNVIPANCVYVRARPLISSLNDVMVWIGQSAALPTEFVPFAYIDGAQVSLNGRKLDTLLAAQNSYEGKKWTSYGDSITEMNMWQPYVVDSIGIIPTNRGVGGTMVAGDSVVVGPDTRYSMNRDERINTIPTDTEVITVMGGSNDWSNGIPIGTISDTTNTTFYGAYKIMLDKIKTRAPGVRIIIMQPPFRDQEGTLSISGQLLDQFRTAIRNVAYLYGYQLIDLRANAGINQTNFTTYLSDVVHPNDAGGRRIAEVVSGNMKLIQPTS